MSDYDSKWDASLVDKLTDAITNENTDITDLISLSLNNYMLKGNINEIKQIINDEKEIEKLTNIIEKIKKKMMLN